MEVSESLILDLSASEKDDVFNTNRNIGVWLRDISQAYTQSTTKLNRLFYAKLPEQFKNLYPNDTIIVVLKPLYGIPEAGTHWWVTYMNHHKKELGMQSSTYDPCLLITEGDILGLVGMQTDDTLILGDNLFSELEERKLQFTAKPKQKLTRDKPLIFNGCILTLNDDFSIHMTQKNQGKKIDLVEDIDSKVYVQQRARGAYIASICQPEACYDLSVAAQTKNPSKDDLSKLNKRLQWQKNNLDRGLNNVVLNLRHAKLFIFVDASFANNEDLSSQIGYIIVIANETNQEDHKFTITSNIIHYSSTKSKRVTRSVLASEIYGMVGGVDMGYAIATTINLIFSQLDLPEIPIIVCTDSYSLYECIVKLGTTKEKRLMIDIMALRQSYERRELYEIRWINGADNPGDAMTKANPNKALETLIDTNSLDIRIEGWVKRE
ncbi:hypothetical protein EV44_g3709 [Erysiphe necator]|uniref:Reverse transcriptase Ty1/copia-type domain-containing protein n=1 Tax=Uncinula necator TaxID=52586 RepID=A0A0B1PCL6_UNCNE|nr:hypothetical protein EV44_g3709 [Erysiphe necator]